MQEYLCSYQEVIFTSTVLKSQKLQQLTHEVMMVQTMHLDNVKICGIRFLFKQPLVLYNAKLSFAASTDHTVYIISYTF